MGYQSSLQADNQGPQRAESLLIDPSDLVFPAPGGGLLRVPVGGGAPAPVNGTANGQLWFYDQTAGLWVPTSSAPSDGQIARWNAGANTWEFVPEPNLGALQYLDTTYAPIGLWNFDGTLADQSGNGNDLTNAAGQMAFADVVPGKLGLYLLAGTRYQTAAAVPLLQRTGDMSMVCIAQQDSAVNLTVLAGYAGPGETQPDNILYQLAYEAYLSTDLTPRRLRYFHEFGAGVNVSFSSSLTVSLPPVHNIVFLGFTRIANVVQLYVNGLPFGAPSAALTPPDGGAGANTRYLFGASDTSTTVGSTFVAFSHALYGGGLSAAQMKDLYNLTLGPAFGRLP